MNPITKLLSWLRPAADPEAEAEAQRIRQSLETVKTSQISGSGVSSLPPTPDVTDPRR